MFKGADVDGLDQIATISTAGADATDAVKAVCEALVAAGSLFGPAGAAFITYLKTTVIPWLTVVSTALRSFATVLKAASTVQRAVSAGETVDTSSQPTYQSPEQLPTGDTRNYPVVSEDGGSSAGSDSGDSSSSGASTADGCGKDDGAATTVATADGCGTDDSSATTVPAADSCGSDDAVKTETVATSTDNDSVPTEDLAKDSDSSGKDGHGDSSGGNPPGTDGGPKPPADGDEPELEFLGQPLVDEHNAVRPVHDPVGANVTKVMFFEAGADGPGGLDVQTGLALGLAGVGAVGLAKLAYGKRSQVGATTADADDDLPVKARTSGDTFAGGGHNVGGAAYGAPAGIDAFPGGEPKATTRGAVADKLVSAGVDDRGQLSGVAAGGLKVGGYAGLAHGLGGPGDAVADIDGLAPRGDDPADQTPRPVGTGHDASAAGPEGGSPTPTSPHGTAERQSGHGAATVAPVWPNRNR